MGGTVSQCEALGPPKFALCRAHPLEEGRGTPPSGWSAPGLCTAMRHGGISAVISHPHSPTTAAPAPSGGGGEGGGGAPLPRLPLQLQPHRPPSAPTRPRTKHPPPARTPRPVTPSPPAAAAPPRARRPGRAAAARCWAHWPAPRSGRAAAGRRATAPVGGGSTRPGRTGGRGGVGKGRGGGDVQNPSAPSGTAARAGLFG